MKKVLILNSCLREKGSTQKLVDAFADGARDAGNEAHEIRLADIAMAQCRLRNRPSAS